MKRRTLISIIAGIVLLDEKLQFGIVVGGVLILIGIFLSDRADTQAFGCG